MLIWLPSFTLTKDVSAIGNDIFTRLAALVTDADVDLDFMLSSKPGTIITEIATEWYADDALNFSPSDTKKLDSWEDLDEKNPVRIAMAQLKRFRTDAKSDGPGVQYWLTEIDHKMTDVPFQMAISSTRALFVFIARPLAKKTIGEGKTLRASGFMTSDSHMIRVLDDVFEELKKRVVKHQTG